MPCQVLKDSSQRWQYRGRVVLIELASRLAIRFKYLSAKLWRLASLNSRWKAPGVRDTPYHEVVAGDKESDVCSMHGTCDEKEGVCNCFEEWITSNGYGDAGKRGDCGYRQSGTTSSCPGEPACLGHGICSGPPNYRCECEQGRSGPDCALIDCPVGKSWFSFPTEDNYSHEKLAECSDMGNNYDLENYSKDTNTTGLSRHVVC